MIWLITIALAEETSINLNMIAKVAYFIHYESGLFYSEIVLMTSGYMVN